MREDRKKKDVNDLQKEARQLLLNHFRPEFLNRIDEIIPFRNLSLSHIRHICRMQLEQLQTRLTSQGIQLEMTEAAEVYLAQRGYDPVFGARPMKRTLQRDVQDPIAIRLLDGELRREVVLQWDLEHLFGGFFSLALHQKRGRSPAALYRLQQLPS